MVNSLYISYKHVFSFSYHHLWLNLCLALESSPSACPDAECTPGIGKGPVNDTEGTGLGGASGWAWAGQNGGCAAILINNLVIFAQQAAIEFVAGFNTPPEVVGDARMEVTWPAPADLLLPWDPQQSNHPSHPAPRHGRLSLVPRVLGIQIAGMMLFMYMSLCVCVDYINIGT